MWGAELAGFFSQAAIIKGKVRSLPKTAQSLYFAGHPINGEAPLLFLFAFCR